MTPDPQLFDFAAVRQSEDQIVAALREAKKLPSDTPRVGLAISGGGIRSATFALGVLQALHQANRLNTVQLLSTVSGGGYIGSWLVSAYRNGQNEAALEPQSAAVHHLRQYSRYLSPQGGALSADAWTILANWLRNAGLIQISVILALAAVILLPQFAVWMFDLLPGLSQPISPWQGPTKGAWFLPGLLSLVFLLVALFSIRREIASLRSPAGRDDLDQGRVIGRIVVPVLISSTLAAIGLSPVIKLKQSILIELLNSSDKLHVLGAMTFYELLFHLAPMIVLGGVAFYVAWIARQSTKLSANSLGVVVLATTVCTLAAGVCFFMLSLAATMVDVVWGVPFGPWWPLLGPSLILLTFGQLLTLLVGVLGRDMPDEQREWWNRLCAWMLILATAILMVVLVAITGPSFLGGAWSGVHSIMKPAAFLGWAGSTLAGVMAAKSGKTSDEKGPGAKHPLNWVAVAGPYIFILGLVLVVAWILQEVIVGIEPLFQIEYCRVAAASMVLAAVLIFGAVAWGRFDLNEFSMNHFYRNRLVRCYMGATNPMPHPQPFTGFDFNDDWELASLLNTDNTAPVPGYTGPYPIVNTALNTSQGGDLSVQDRRAESFIFSPAFSGRAGRELSTGGQYRQTRQYIVPNCGIRYGTTVAISGAAASPNMGYHTSPVAAFLLTVFNVRLGWWVPNPMREWWQKSSPAWQLAYLVRELFGSARTEDRFVYLSDGGHFENLAVYELVRRHCDVIVVSDAEEDGQYHFEGLAGVIRKCWIDFRVKIEIDVNPVEKRQADGFSKSHFAVGTIKYPGVEKTSTLIYMKASLTGDEATDIVQFKKKSPCFPHDPTSDQFFTEDQFESYRRLGEHVGSQPNWAELLAPAKT